MKLCEQIGCAATCEYLAETAANLANASLLVARYHRGENPTDVSFEAYKEHMEDALADTLYAIEQVLAIKNVNAKRIDDLRTYLIKDMEERFDDTIRVGDIVYSEKESFDKEFEVVEVGKAFTICRQLGVGHHPEAFPTEDLLKTYRRVQRHVRK